MAKFMGLDKLFTVPKIIKANGGLRASLYKLYRMDDLKMGECVGEDKYGNKYYENTYFFVCRNRWVEYAPHYKLEYDGSQIPAEWFGWMHHRTDVLPFKDRTRPKYSWMMDHTENLSGTKYQYYPYSTTKPKIKAWNPNEPTKDLMEE